MLKYNSIKKYFNFIITTIVLSLIGILLLCIGKNLYINTDFFIYKQIYDIFTGSIYILWFFILFILFLNNIRNINCRNLIKNKYSIKKNINLKAYYLSVLSLLVILSISFIKLHGIVKIDSINIILLKSLLEKIPQKLTNYRDFIISINSWYKSWEYFILFYEPDTENLLIKETFDLKLMWRTYIIKVSSKYSPYVFYPSVLNNTIIKENNYYNFNNYNNNSNYFILFPFKIEYFNLFSEIINLGPLNDSFYSFTNEFLLLIVKYLNEMFYRFYLIISNPILSNIFYGFEYNHYSKNIFDTFILKTFKYSYSYFNEKVYAFFLGKFQYFLVNYIIKNIFLDGVSLWLTWLVITVSYIISYSKNKKKVFHNHLFRKNFIYNHLLNSILILMIICFLTKDIFIFFISFECILFPLFFYIILQGSRLNRILAVKYLVIYTVIGSIFLWYSIAYFVEILGISNFEQIKYVILNTLSSGTRKVLFISLFIGFAFKVPLVPFHHWLVIAHVEAPTNGSIILAALLLKVGGYGLYRFVYNLFPIEILLFSNLIILISVFGFTYASILAVRQIDVKRYIAYTSIAHMNYSLIGLFSGNEIGILGYIHIMISHGIISTALFYLIGHLYSVLHFRDTLRLSGIAYIFPKFSIFFFIFSIANMGLPLFSGFPGEFFIFISILSINEYFSFFIFFGFMFSGIYTILQLNKILFSSYVSDIIIKKNEDIDNYSILILSVLLFWSITLGIFPDIVTKNVEISISL